MSALLPTRSLAELPFVVICRLFEGLISIRYSKNQGALVASAGKGSKKNRAVNVVHKWFTNVSNIGYGGDVFAVFALFLPDQCGRVYNAAADTIISAVTTAFALSDSTRRRMKAYKSQLAAPSNGASFDLATFLTGVVKTELKEQPSLTVGALHSTLNSLADLSVWSMPPSPAKGPAAVLYKPKDTERVQRQELLAQLFRQCSVHEFPWLVRIVLRDLKLGFPSDIFFEGFDSRMVSLAKVHNLKTTCRKIKELTTSLPKSTGPSPSSAIALPVAAASSTESIPLELQFACGSFFQPQLCLKSTGASDALDRAWKESRGGRAVPGATGSCRVLVEDKYDGHRWQVHVRFIRGSAQPEVMFFSRAGNALTQRTTKNSEQMKAFMLAGLHPAMRRDCIFDCEMVAVDEENGTKLHGDHSTVSGLVFKHTRQSWDMDHAPHIHGCFVFFDAVMVNGQRIGHWPLALRKQALSQAVRSVPGKVLVSTGHVLDGREEIALSQLSALMLRSIHEKKEGLVVKPLNCQYGPGSRGGWIKMKADYIPGLLDTLDVAVVGGTLGEGKMAGHISSLVVAVRTAHGESSVWTAVFAVACMAKNEELHQTLVPRLTPLRDKAFPPWLCVMNRRAIEANAGKVSASGWMVLKHPHEAIVVELLGAKLRTHANSRGQEWAELQFPRVRSIKSTDPRDLDEVMTLPQLVKIAKESSVTAPVRANRLLQPGGSISESPEPISLEQYLLQDVAAVRLEDLCREDIPAAAAEETKAPPRVTQQSNAEQRPAVGRTLPVLLDAHMRAESKREVMKVLFDAATVSLMGVQPRIVLSIADEPVLVVIEEIENVHKAARHSLRCFVRSFVHQASVRVLGDGAVDSPACCAVGSSFFRSLPSLALLNPPDFHGRRRRPSLSSVDALPSFAFLVQRGLSQRLCLHIHQHLMWSSFQLTAEKIHNVLTQDNPSKPCRGRVKHICDDADENQNPSPKYRKTV